MWEKESKKERIERKRERKKSGKYFFKAQEEKEGEKEGRKEDGGGKRKVRANKTGLQRSCSLPPGHQLYPNTL